MWCARVAIVIPLSVIVIAVNGAPAPSGCEYNSENDETKCRNMEFVVGERVPLERFGKKLDLSLIRGALYGSDVFGTQSDVTELIIRSSNISRLQHDLFNTVFPNLQSLLIKINHGFPNITVTDVFPSNCCHHLTALKVYDNNFRVFDRQVFENLPNLEQLIVEDQYVGPLEANYFRGLGQLKRLRLQQCQIRQIDVDAFDDLTQLVKLELPTNEVETIRPGTFKNLKNLEELQLSGNIIRNFIGGEFNGLINLQRLELVGNKIHSINVDKILENLPRLKRIGIKLTYFECKMARRLVEKMQENHVEIKNIDQVYATCRLVDDKDETNDYSDEN